MVAHVRTCLALAVAILKAIHKAAAKLGDAACCTSVTLPTRSTFAVSVASPGECGCERYSAVSRLSHWNSGTGQTDDCFVMRNRP